MRNSTETFKRPLNDNEQSHLILVFLLTLLRLQANRFKCMTKIEYHMATHVVPVRFAYCHIHRVSIEKRYFSLLFR